VLKKKVTSFITKNNLISGNDNIAVAFSAGRDSVCLLYILNLLKTEMGFTLSAIHVNHGIRGRESDKDQAYAEKFCQDLGISCTSFKLSGFNKSSSEDVLRKARYKVFDDYIRKNNKVKIATGHHLNDQLETYLMRLFKGSGAKGLLGIPIVRENYIRPMLEISRKEITDFCKKNGISFREDQTNAVADKLRNMIRLNLVPQIEDIFGENYLLYFMKSHSAIKNLYSDNWKLNIDFFKNVVNAHNDQIEIALKDISCLSHLQKAQFLEYCFYSVYKLDCSISNEQISEFESFLKKAQTGTKFLFIDSIELLKDRDKIIFYPSVKKDKDNKKLYLNKSIKFGDCTFLLNKVVNDYHLDNNLLVEKICGDNIQLPLTVRSWQRGDFFYPLGSNSRQKLSDFFINNKVSRINKKKIPIICNGNQIVWIAGFRIDDRYKLTSQCNSVLQIEMTYE